MNRCETTKLFYDKYEYKLVVRNQLAYLFRERNFSYAKSYLDELQSQFEKGHPLKLVRYLRETSVNTLDFQESQILFNTLTKNNNYKLRVEQPRMQIYSNDKAFLTTLSNKLKLCVEFWEPIPGKPLVSNTIMLTRKIPFEYRVTLASKTSPNFAAWYENNKDKVKIGATCLREIQQNGFTQGLYFYVRDEKVLNLLHLVVGDSIARIDKVIYKQELDK